MADVENGYEVFFFEKQKRYKCRSRWSPSGAPCAYNTYDLKLMRVHEREVHGSAPGVKASRPNVPLLFDADEKPLPASAFDHDEESGQ